MKWSEKEINMLKEHYEDGVYSINTLSNLLYRTKKSIRQKAARENLSRPRINIDRKQRNRKDRKTIDKEYYEKNKEEIFRKRKERRRRIKNKLIIKLGGECKHCGDDRECCLDFHHTSDNKECCVSTAIYNENYKLAKKEANKCILLCANCHRVVHYNY